MLYIELDLGEKEEINLSDYTKDKIEYYSSKYNKTKGQFISDIIESYAEELRHPEQENVHLTELPKYIIDFNMILICEKGFTIIDVVESEECDDKYIVEYKQNDCNETYYVDLEDLRIGINRKDAILYVPLASSTDVYLTQEEKEFIGVD